MADRSTSSNGKGKAGPEAALSGIGPLPEGGPLGLAPSTTRRERITPFLEARPQDGPNADSPACVSPVGRGLDLLERAMSLRLGLRPPRGEFSEAHPVLYEALCTTKDKKDRTIEGLSFTFVASGDSYVIFLKWPLGGVSTTLAMADPLSLWIVLEEAITGKLPTSWKEMRRVPRHLKKGSDIG